MRAKKLANTSSVIPELAFGTWLYRGGVPPLRAAIEQGAFFIDTAESYGSEPTVGQAIEGIRNQVFIATKVSPRHFRYADVLKAAECSLRQLKTDYIDLYQLHWPNYTVDIAETMSAMERLVEMGKVRYIGVSNFTTSELKKAQAALSKVHIVSNQVRYSLLDRTPERGLLQYCQENKVSILAYSPLATGFARLRAADPNDALGRVAKEVQKTRAQVAINWCLRHEPVFAIVKTENVDHVHENCEAAGWRLTDDQFGLLTRSIQPYRTRYWPENAARRLVRRFGQYAGRSLGLPTACDSAEQAQSGC